MKALRDRTKLKEEIKTAQNRAETSAVTYEDEPSDFNVVDQLTTYGTKQNELRASKMAVIKASLNTLIPINTALVPESGTEVPLYQAVLIRDDLKGRKSLLTRLAGFPTSTKNDRYYSEGPVTKKIRNFPLDGILSEINSIQEAIDEIDVAIQYADSTTEVVV
jgi:hypothetical protein